MTSDYSPRQLCALLAAALAAPLVTVCADVSWQWVLLAAAMAGCFLIYMVWAAGTLPPHQGLGALLRQALGAGAARWIQGFLWLWLVLLAGMGCCMAAAAFPQDRAFPLIPLVLLLIAARVSAKGAAAVCRFGGVLCLAVVSLLLAVLAFGGRDLRWENLRPAGNWQDLAGPLAVLLLPAAGLMLRDRLSTRGVAWSRWFLLAAGLGTAVSVVTVGALGLPLARAAAHPFWLMSRSVSILGVMERFEAVVSALLSLSFCCLLALLTTLGRKALQGALPAVKDGPAVWLTTAAGGGVMWLIPLLPAWVWPLGSLLFWGVLPAVVLGVVRHKIMEK